MFGWFEKRASPKVKVGDCVHGAGVRIHLQARRPIVVQTVSRDDGALAELEM
jgi:hypothetical protein